MAELPASSSREIAVEKFVPSDQIDPMLFEKSYYLEPEKTGAKPYALLRAGAQGRRPDGRGDGRRSATGCRSAVLRVRDDVIVMQTMMWPDEIRKPDFAGRRDRATAKPAEVKMANMLVETLAGDFDADEFEDDYAEAVEALVQGQDRGRRGQEDPEQPKKSSGEVVDLLAALQRSVDAAKTARGESAPASWRTRAREKTAKKAAAKKPAPRSPRPRSRREEDDQEGGRQEGQLTGCTIGTPVSARSVPFVPPGRTGPDRPGSGCTRRAPSRGAMLARVRPSHPLGTNRMPEALTLRIGHKPQLASLPSGSGDAAAAQREHHAARG